MDAGAPAALIGALALVLVPGGVLAHVLGFRGLWWLAVSPVVSVAAFAATGVIVAPTGLRFAWWQPVVLALAADAVVLAVRATRHRRLLPPVVGRWNRGSGIAIGAIAVAAIVTGLVAGAGIGEWSHVSQTYDGVFHLNAVAWIQSTGDGSSFDLYRITHPGTTDNEFYPAAWHDLVASTVQLTGASIPVATNAVWMAVQALVWTPGVALLAGVVVPARWRGVAPALGALASIGFLGFPDLLLAWGTLYPTALAYALLPVGVVLTVRLLHWIALLPVDRRLPAPVLLLVTAGIWLVASALAHPRSLFGWVVITVPLLVIEGGRAIRRVWRRPSWRRGLIVVLSTLAALVIAGVAIGALYVYRTFDLAHRPISDHLNGGPATATEGPLAALGQVLALAPPDPNGGPALPVAWALGALVVLGTVVALIRARVRWLAIGAILVAALYVLAAGSNSDLAKVLTGVWYKDKFRLFALLPIVQIPLVVVLGIEVLDRLRNRARTVGAVVVAAAVGIAVLTSNVLIGAPRMIDRVFALGAHDKQGRLLDANEERLLVELPRFVPSGDRVLDDPWDGSALSWAIGDREPVFPHFAGVWTSDEVLVAAQLDHLLDSPAVCDAVGRLGVRWVVEDPQLLWGGPPESAAFGGIHRAVQTGLLIPVAHVGSAGLYRIPVCTG